MSAYVPQPKALEGSLVVYEDNMVCVCICAYICVHMYQYIYIHIRTYILADYFDL